MSWNGRPLGACELVLRTAGLLVPRHRRAEWLREWRAELWHEGRQLAAEGRRGLPATAHLLRRSLGSVQDAIAVRRFHPAPAQEDLVSALNVVFRSPGAAGAGMLVVAIATMANTVAVSVSRFVAFIPGEYRAPLLGLSVTLVLLLAVASCIAAAAAVAWSDAARREEAMRRAMGIPERRLRRQRALEGVLVAAAGSAGGAWLGAGLLQNTRMFLKHGGALEAAASLDARPGAATIGLGLALLMTVLLATMSTLRRRRPLLE